MRLSSDLKGVAASVLRYGLLAVLGIGALALVRGMVSIEDRRVAGEEQRPDVPIPTRATQAEGGGLAEDAAELDSMADGQAARMSPAPLVELAPRSVLARLRMPVAGVTPETLTDSFTDARSGGRTHHALDIMAPEGTAVRAATDGTLARIHTSERGGKSLYQVGPDSAYVFYYAHLDAYAPGLAEGQAVRKGDVLGTVGSTGNARTPHLHFGIWTFEDGSVWGGTPVNPYPWLAD